MSSARRIMKVTEVAMSRTEGQVEVIAKGLVPTSGWSRPALIVVDDMPDDAVLDLAFVATPPSQWANQVISPIQVKALFDDEDQAIHCIIVHALTNQAETCVL